MVQTFVDYGEAIFPPKPKGKIAALVSFTKRFNAPQYRAEMLREVITKLIDKDATLNDVVHAVGIPAVNVTEGRPQVFKSRHKKEWTRDWKLKAVDVALATSAAPTFFELAEVGGCLYADGGLFANAPDLLALHEAEYFFGVHSEAFRMLSIGTTTQSYSVAFSAGRQFGIYEWMRDVRAA